MLPSPSSHHTLWRDPATDRYFAIPDDVQPKDRRPGAENADGASMLGGRSRSSRILAVLARRAPDQLARDPGAMLGALPDAGRRLPHLYRAEHQLVAVSPPCNAS
jgi:hypothetical protein